MRARSVLIWLLVLLGAGIESALAETAPAASNGPLQFLGGDLYAKSAGALTMLAVVAVLLENAFATIFNWRVFLSYFSVRGVKTIVMVLISYIVVTKFDLDIFGYLLNAYNPKAETGGALSNGITALMLSGGSGAIFEVMKSLGFRVERSVEPQIARPKEEAWVAIHVKRDKAVGEIKVLIGTVDPQPPAAERPLPLAGTVVAQQPRLLDLILRNPSRFPRNDGYKVRPDVVYRIEVVGQNGAGEQLHALHGQTYVFAPGAIIDFHVKL